MLHSNKVLRLQGHLFSKDSASESIDLISGRNTSIIRCEYSFDENKVNIINHKFMLSLLVRGAIFYFGDKIRRDTEYWSQERKRENVLEQPIDAFDV